MAIKNTLLGGNDWLEGSKLLATDVNDTIDEFVRLVENGY